MVTRHIVHIDEEKCTGCGECVPAGAEGAIEIIDGKARLVKEIYCDGLGACLGECPEDAITIEEREAEAFDEKATEKHVKAIQEKEKGPDELPCGCPGSMMRKLNIIESPQVAAKEPSASCATSSAQSLLGHWPVQIHLLPPRGEIWENADVLIAADCVPFAMPDFHERLLGGKTVAVGCPKLDDLDYYQEKLTDIFANNSIRSVTVAHMEVPCCTGILIACQNALKLAGKADLPFHDVMVGIKGAVLSET